MNDFDKENLEFILSRTPDELARWFETIKEYGDEYEISYAIEMLAQARNHVEMQLIDLFDQDVKEDVSQAAEYLQRFRLNHGR